MAGFIPLLASLRALAGTFMQAHDNLTRLKELDPEGADSFNTVDGLKTEYRMSRNPVQWVRRQSEVRQLLAESPVEASLYKRVRRLLISWLLLTFAALLAAITALVSLLWR
jgi:hypothetical protein